MAPDEDFELPQTQSQTETEENFVVRQRDEHGIWGHLLAKHQTFHDVGKCDQIIRLKFHRYTNLFRFRIHLFIVCRSFEKFIFNRSSNNK